jgi:tetratricopeptide (TPR) repeat protein
MPVRRSRYKPALNAQCLCGSGLKFKRCCLGENDVACGKKIDLARDSMLKRDYKSALKYVRHGITNYTILHKTNTEPYILSKNKGVIWLLDIDIKALSELVDSLLDCYRGLNDYDSFECDLERLRRNISEHRWQRKITYFKVLASLGEYWPEKVGKREVKKFLPLDDEYDPEIIQLYLHFYLDELTFKNSIDMLDRLISLIEKPSGKLQYTVVKAIKYLCIEDEVEADRLIDTAIKEYESTDWSDDNSYGHMQHARALSLLGDLRKSAKLKVRSIQQFEKLRENHSWTNSGIAEINFEIGKSLFHIKKFEEALVQYEKSLELKNSEIVKVFVAQSQLDLENQIAITTINKVDIEKLSDAEKLDFIFTYASIAIAFKQKEMLERSLTDLSEIPLIAPIFEKQKSMLTSEISLLYRTGELKEKSNLLGVLKKLIGYTSRYLILQPNIAGLGVNINNIANDLAKESNNKNQSDA